ncbi:MAG: 50S ribosomal protein L9 [Aggregatilineales bacterium]
MQVILLQDIYKHGVAGEVVKVADGFARNFLIPRKMAVRATKVAMAEHEALQAQVEARRAQYEDKVNEVARAMDGVELFFERRAASTGKLFGSVTTTEIADELETKTGLDINRRRISQHGLRELGTHRVPVRIGTEESPELVITIVREGELREFLVERERAAAAGEAMPDAAEFDADEPTARAEDENALSEPIAEDTNAAPETTAADMSDAAAEAVAAVEAEAEDA